MQEHIRTLSAKGKIWWAKRPTIQKIGLIVAVVVVLYVIFHHKDPLANASVETVKQQDLVRTVLASGTVTSSTDLALSFQASDVVNSVRVAVGQKVKKGQILATLTSNEENAALTKARGQLLAAQAAYNKVLEGTSNEEIKVAQTNLDTTKAVQDGLVQNAYRKLLSDGLEAVPQSAQASDNVPTISGTYTGAEGQYIITPDLIGGKHLEISGLEHTTADISMVQPKPLGTKGLNIIFESDSDFSNGKGWVVDIPNVKSDSYVANLNAYQAAVQARDAAVAQAQAELDLKKATARQSDVDAALANVITAQAGLEDAQAKLDKKILRAPADGTITKVDLKIGEIPPTTKGVVTLQDIANLYLEASVNESDIPELSIGQPVTVTYDAFGADKTYTAKISSIDLASTVSDGVVNYKVKALIDDTDTIKPGMTANLTIITASKPAVLVIPKRAITTTGSTKTVQVLVDERKGKTQSRTITTGLVGDGDVVEVTSGLAEGEKVVSFTPKK